MTETQPGSVWSRNSGCAWGQGGRRHWQQGHPQPVPPAVPAAGHGERHDPGNGDAGAAARWDNHAGAACPSAGSAVLGSVSPTSTGPSTGLGCRQLAEQRSRQGHCASPELILTAPRACRGTAVTASPSEGGWNLSQCFKTKAPAPEHLPGAPCDPQAGDRCYFMVV